MSPEIIAALIGAGATLIVGAPTIWYMRASHRAELHAAWREAHRAQETIEIYRRTVQEAPKRFAATLEQLITDATLEVGRTNLIPAVRALVAARNGFESVLDTLKNRLNSQITQLEQELKGDRPDPRVIEELIESLKRSWPAKKQEIEAAVRKVLVDLGVTVSERIYGSADPNYP